MDKWWESEARLCESHGLHIMASLARKIGSGEAVAAPSPIERARARLAEIEARVRVTFSRKGGKRLHFIAVPKQKETL